MSTDPPKSTFKRKRKKSFLQNARKYAKKGWFGRGASLEEDTYQYFVRIMEAYKEGFENDEDKALFANNVFEQTLDKEVTCSSNQVGCRVVETLLPFANDQVFQRFFKAFSEDLRPLCCDRFATHVLETLVKEACKREQQAELYRSFFLKISKFLLNNLEDYIWDTYGNHVIRTCLKCLSGIQEEDTKQGKPQILIKEEPQELDSEFSEIIIDYGERILAWPQFEEMCHTELTSGFLQILLKALKKTDKKLLKQYLDKLAEIFGGKSDEIQDKNILPAVFLTKPLIMLLETSLQVAKKRTFSKIYVKCFSGRLNKLATLQTTNFSVQKLLTNCREKLEFEEMFEELNDYSKIIEVGYGGVLLALAQGCKRLSTKQGAFVQNLLKGLQCENSENDLILCTSRLKPLEKSKSHTNDNLHKEKLNLQGTLIIQLMLEFNKPIKIVNSILSLSEDVLEKLFTNTMGSHIVDSFVTSQFVGEKSREKLTQKMKGHYQELASTKFGSRSFEALWKASNPKTRHFIMEEMVHKEASWSHTEFGKIIASKINLVLYRRNKDEWRSSLNKQPNKVQELFAEVLK